jgi:hypothetical protein
MISFAKNAEMLITARERNHILDVVLNVNLMNLLPQIPYFIIAKYLYQKHWK